MEGFRYLQFYFVFQGRESEIFRDILSEGKLMGRDTAIRSNMTSNFLKKISLITVHYSNLTVLNLKKKVPNNYEQKVRGKLLLALICGVEDV